MNFLNFPTSASSCTPSATSVFNFGLHNLLNNFGFKNNTDTVASKQDHSSALSSKSSPSSPEKQVGPNKGDEVNKQSEVELFTKQQQLINQYMHLNIQLLSKKLQNLEHTQKLEEQVQSEIKNSKKKIKKITNCGHNDREHYAKGMCNNCYHRYGRNKKPWNCPHDKLYANGMCQNCYINSYNKKRREERSEQKNQNCEIGPSREYPKVKEQ